MCPVTLQGASAGHTVIDGQKAIGVLKVTDKAAPVTVAGVTLEHGSDETGGAINGFGSTTSLTVRESLLTENHAKFEGGAIYGEGTLTVVSSSITANDATAGGGIFDFGAPFTLARSTVSGNRATEGEGGGIGLEQGSEEGLTATDSTIAGNSATTYGGGIGVETESSLALRYATVAGNAAPTGGALGASGKATLTIEGSILAGDAANECAGMANASAVGANIVFGSSSCAFTGTAPLASDPRLGALSANGGLGATLALLEGSAALNAGGASCPAADTGGGQLDQRGVARPQGPACDIGAFELALPSATTGAASGVGKNLATVSGAATNHDVDGGSVYFQYGMSSAYGSQTPAQALAAGATAPFTAALVGLPAGTVVHFRAVASNPAGPAFGADQTFTTLSTSVPVGLPSSISAASLTNKRFRVSRRPTAISAAARRRTPLGTRFRFTLSAAAKLTIAITRSTPGLRHGRSCVAPSTKLIRRHAKHCTRTLSVGTLTRASEAAGAHSVAFSGRIGHRPLAPHSYRALLTASNANGRSKPVTLTFTIVR